MGRLSSSKDACSLTLPLTLITLTLTRTLTLTLTLILTVLLSSKDAAGTSTQQNERADMEQQRHTFSSLFISSIFFLIRLFPSSPSVLRPLQPPL